MIFYSKFFNKNPLTIFFKHPTVKINIEFLIFFLLCVKNIKSSIYLKVEVQIYGSKKEEASS